MGDFIGRTAAEDQRAFDASEDRGLPPLDLCSHCSKPTHASESDDNGICLSCRAAVLPSAVKVDALIAGHISIADGTFTAQDFRALALAAADQGGVSMRDQERIAAILSTYGDAS